MLKVSLHDGKTDSSAEVNNYNQLVTGDISFSDFYSVLLDVDNQAYNLVKPKANQVFIIKNIILSANRNVGVNGSNVQIYESSDGSATTTISKAIYTDDLVKQTRVFLTGLNLKVTKGSWVNAKCDDDDVRVTIGGYYIKDLN